MALNSVSLRKGQVPLSCHFCNEQAVHWKCEECDVFMCTSCKDEIHQRLKSAHDHEIVSISDISKRNFPQRDVASEVISSVCNTYTTAVPVINSLSRSADWLNGYISTVSGRLVAVDTNGRLKFTYIGNKNCKTFYAYGIAITPSDDIILSDKDSNALHVLNTKGELLCLHFIDKDYWMDEYHGGRIVAVDVNGQLKFTYNGDLYLETFLPHGIAITPSDNIILSDEKSNSLHILNSRGELLGLHFIEKEYGIVKPHSLCIDSEGYLLIDEAL
ncbi:unnamed protein product [Mytilus edulis]|uniref:B box-type domain-containing protein n=1 Tax=Mytilus edulis TaxID=6550 RepID=A0A8S3TZA2_MYTED|nr:unnamed protein product [Mytilus edulis]